VATGPHEQENHEHEGQKYGVSDNTPLIHPGGDGFGEDACIDWADGSLVCRVESTGWVSVNRERRLQMGKEFGGDSGQPWFVGKPWWRGGGGVGEGGGVGGSLSPGKGVVILEMLIACLL
jgi:hypothetical protein